jgi:hypothetical protein
MRGEMIPGMLEVTSVRAFHAEAELACFAPA